MSPSEPRFFVVAARPGPPSAREVEEDRLERHLPVHVLAHAPLEDVDRLGPPRDLGRGHSRGDLLQAERDVRVRDRVGRLAEREAVDVAAEREEDVEAGVELPLLLCSR
jgi:hypothetical protein